MDLFLQLFAHLNLYLSHFRRNSSKTVKSVYDTFVANDVLQVCFPKVFSLLQYSLILPSSNAMVERRL